MESRSQFTQTFHSYVIPVYAFINRQHYICLRLVTFRFMEVMAASVLCDTLRRAGDWENFAYVCTSFIQLAYSLLSHFVVTSLSRLDDKLVTLGCKREVCIMTLRVSH